MNKVQKLTFTALMAALCYVAFTFLQIKVQTPAGYTSFHLGNVFCVLAALMFDGTIGGLAGAIGMGIGDLFDPVYVITAPKTIILKFLMGYITGFLAHKVFDIKNQQGKRLFKAVLLSIGGGMAFNLIGEPLLSFLYYDLLLNNSQKAQSYLTIAKLITTGTNAVLTLVVATTLYLLIVKRMPDIKK